jgi:hypothetical protein
MRSVGADAFVQTIDTKKIRTIVSYQPTMSLLVVENTYLEWSDGELMVKELTVELYLVQISRL